MSHEFDNFIDPPMLYIEVKKWLSIRIFTDDRQVNHEFTSNKWLDDMGYQ